MRIFIAITLFLCSQILIAQPDSLFIKSKENKFNVPKWVQKNRAGLDISEVAFVNWNAGGSNSISALMSLVSSLNYSYKHFYWNNDGVIRFGVNKQEEYKLRKTEDVIELNSNLGFRKDTLTNWFYSARFNFRTQFMNGYNYPDRDNPISRFMAPGYLFVGGGVEHKLPNKKGTFYFSPVTVKATFVLDEDLANAGSFGVNPAVYDDFGNLLSEGQRIRNEVGILLTNAYETKIIENIFVKNQVSVYTDYVNSFGNVDVDWLINFDFKVNNYVKASLGSHLKYDDDVKTLVATEIPDEFEERGAKIQWKQLLGVGVVVDF
uniref:DUF3078 domain-containing protein n=1 Tax=Gelidibacter sp. TaxID=2018083 RepID=UPI004049A6B7